MWGALLFAFLLTSGPPVAVTVEHGHIFPEPATIRLRVTVEPAKANRHLWVAIEATGYSTAHYEQLDDASPRTRIVEFKDLPGGDYGVFIRVQRAKGRGLDLTARESFVVVGPTYTPFGVEP